MLKAVPRSPAPPQFAARPTTTPLYHHPLDAALPWARRRLVPRRSLPSMSVVRLQRSPLERLAGLLGFGR